MELKHLVSEVLLARAKSLESLGLQEEGWTKGDALQLLAQLADKKVAVLGGDVYSTASGRLEPTYENWFCERCGEEDLGTYARRSQKEAMAFLRDYPGLLEVLFVLVLSQDETAGL